MPGNPQASVYIGNVDEKVDERVLYEIMVQAGPLVDLHMPRDKETKRHKGYAFAEFTTEKSALYAVNLFSGLVCLHKKLLRFSIAGQDKVVQTPSSEVRDVKLSDINSIDASSQNSQRPPMPIQGPPVGYCHSPVGSLLATSPVSLYPSAVQSSYLGVGQRLEFSPLSHSHNYSTVVNSAHSNYSGISQRLDFSPLVHAQDYNARLVSLGQAACLRSSFHGFDQAIAYRSY